MQISRRNLLIGTGFAGTGLMMPRKSWAPPPPPPPSKGIYAVHFGGATALLCPAANLDFPEFAQRIFCHAKLSLPFATAGTSYRIFELGNPNGGGVLSSGVLCVSFNTGSQKGRAGITITAAPGSGQGVGVTSPFGSIPVKQFFDLKISIDTGPGIIVATINDSPIPGLTYVQGSGNSFSVPFWSVPVYGGGSTPLIWGVGRSPFPLANWLVGDMSDLFIAVTSSFVDPTSQAVKAAFTDSVTHLPIYLPDDGGGVLPSGDDPGILLHGPTSYFCRNLAKTEFTWPAGQSTPGAFAVTGPALTPSSIDPWGFVGV